MGLKNIMESKSEHTLVIDITSKFYGLIIGKGG